MKSLIVPLLIGVALFVGTSCDTVGEVPKLNDLQARYSGLSPGAFRLYDASLDSTFSGAASYYPADELGPAGVDLYSSGYEEVFSGAAAFLKAEGFNEPEVGDEFDIRVGYESPEGQSSSIDGRASVIALGAGGDVSGVFWARVKDNNVFRVGAPRVIEGGFNATFTAR